MKQENVPPKTSKGAVFIPERLKMLDSLEYFSVLATQNKSQPYTSLVNFALTPDCKTIIFATPRNTQKYRNIIKTKSVALLIDNRSKKIKNLMGTEAVTVVGNARPVKKGKSWDAFAGIYIKKHPDLAEFINAPSTALIVVEAKLYLHVSQFQTVSVWNCERR
jgi:nitroimidazol reductase NimA-like FMN-containing flavoprotein (pyridoxamine 5'-phosphate oxidase superfamily)